MKVKCFSEHNGDDTLLYAINLPGAYTRGYNSAVALEKMQQEVISYLKWQNMPVPHEIAVEIVQEKCSELNIKDADSDAIFEEEKSPLSKDEYAALKRIALKSANDFQKLYSHIPNADISTIPCRETFYGKVPRTAREMYEHTKNVNTYYWSEIGVVADNDGTISECRMRGFDALEKSAAFLENTVREGSYGELWSLRKVLRRFVWHDRIHAKAMYKMALKTFENFNCNPFMFDI